jgi:hypothetical protein
VKDLLAREYQNVSVLDVSSAANDFTKKRLGWMADSVQRIVGDITTTDSPANPSDVWHDRAVFQFLTTPERRVAYVRQVGRAVKSGKYALVSTFGLEGLTKCSRLEVVRDDASSLHAEFGVQFQLPESLKELHETPLGTMQQFLYCLCRVQ